MPQYIMIIILSVALAGGIAVALFLLLRDKPITSASREGEG
jgi:flagellar basal body-associated protein FliL